MSWIELMTIESRCQRSALCEQLFLGRCPKLRLNAALLALNRYERKSIQSYV